MSTNFAYYSARESEQFTFYRIPKALFTNPLFSGLSVEAKLLYGLLLDRMGLSRNNGWIDHYGRVYIYFTHSEIQEYLQCGHNKAVRLLRELDQNLGLIRRKHQGLGRPDRIYVMNFISEAEDKTSENRKPAIPDTQDLPPQEGQNPQNRNPSAEHSHFETSGAPDLGVLGLPSGESNKTDQNKTDKNDTESIYLNLEKNLERAADEIGGYEKELKNKWGYIALLDNHPKEALDGIITLGADVLSDPSPTIRVGGRDIPSAQVRQRLLSLDFTHIDYVLDCMKRTAKPIRNIRNYLLTALYNAPATIDVYYDNLVAQREGLRMQI